MKKFILSLSAVLVSSSLFAATVSVNIPANTMTKVLTGSAKVTQVVLANTNATAVQLKFVDTTTNSLTTSVAAYTNVVSYLTNYINTWTNYFGVTQSWTNTVLIDTSNSVAAATFTNVIPITAVAPANSTWNIDAVNYYFTSGMWVTNASVSNATISVTYQQ